MPVATPVVGFIDARAGMPLVHVPPRGLLLNAVVIPVQVLNVPVIGAGKGYTVTTAVVRFSGFIWYVITAVPAAIPETSPVVRFTAATSMAEEVHVPPGVASLRIVCRPSHTARVPVIGLTAPNDATLITQHNSIRLIYFI